MPDENEDTAVLELLRDAANSRWKLARAMLDAYEANALTPATDEDILQWEVELSEAASEIARLSN